MKAKFIFSIFLAVFVAATTSNIIPKPGFPEDDIIQRGRIINGSPAYSGEAPYIVSLSRDSPTNKHFCAGTIIYDKWILTVAHCMITDNIYVHAGINDRNDRTTGQTVRVEKIFKHDGYTSGISPYDIALLRLERPLQFNSRVQAIAMPTNNVQQTGECTLYGWGRDASDKAPDLLQTVKTDLLPYADCLQQGPWPWKLHPTNICTTSRNTHISTCKGDSGGPLVQKTGDQALLIGIVSWGYLPCGQGNYPSMYTHVGSYWDWIKARLY